MIDPEVFGAELGKVVKEIIAPLKQQIEEQKTQIEQLQQRVAALEELTEGLK